MFKSKTPRVTLITILAQHEAIPPQNIRSSLICFFTVYFGLSLVVGVESAIITFIDPEYDSNLNNIMFSANILISLFSAWITIKHFYKANGRVFNKKEYNKFLKNVLITCLSAVLLLGITTIYLLFDKLDMANQNSVTMYLTLAIASFIALALYALILLAAIQFAILLVYKKNVIK
jgi:hypothetical protein